MQFLHFKFCSFYSKFVDNFLYCTVKKLISNNLNAVKIVSIVLLIPLIRAKILCENNMTCNKIVTEKHSNNNEKDDIYLKKCRKKYKNLRKQVSIGASEKVKRIFEYLKKEYSIYQERYKEGLITGEELLDLLECMKINKKM